MAFIAVDSYHSTIASIAGGTGITSFTVASASGFPALAAGDFTVMRLDDAGTAEDIICTAISGTTVTCVATTIAHANGNTIDGAIQTVGALGQIKDDAHSGFPVNAFSAAGALVKGTGVRNHGTVTSAACTMTLADGTYKGELCRVSMDRTSTKQVTVDPAGATLWDSASTIALFAGDNIIGTWDGTGWITLEKFSSFATPTQLFIANNFYWAASTTVGVTAVSSNVLTRYAPIYIPYTITISQLGARLNTTSAAGNFCFGIYANGTNNQPTGAVLGNTGNLSTTTAGVIMGALGANLQLTQGWYWVAWQVDNATATFLGFNSGSTVLAFGVGVATATNLSVSVATGTTWKSTSTYGTFATNPTITEETIAAVNSPVPIFKVASVP